MLVLRTIAKTMNTLCSAYWATNKEGLLLLARTAIGIWVLSAVPDDG